MSSPGVYTACGPVGFVSWLRLPSWLVDVLPVWAAAYIDAGAINQWQTGGRIDVRHLWGVRVGHCISPFAWVHLPARVGASVVWISSEFMMVMTGSSSS